MNGTPIQIQQRPATPPPFDPSKCVRMACAKCGSADFTERTIIHKMSKIASPDGQEWMYFNKAIICGCGSMMIGHGATPEAMVEEKRQPEGGAA